MHQTVRSAGDSPQLVHGVLCWFVATSRDRNPHPDGDEWWVMSAYESNQLAAPCPISLKHSRTFLLDASAWRTDAKFVGHAPGFLLLVKSRLGQNMRHEFNLRYLQNGLLKLIMCLLFIFVSSTTTCTTSTVVLGNNWSLRNGDKWDGGCVCVCVSEFHF